MYINFSFTRVSCKSFLKYYKNNKTINHFYKGRRFGSINVDGCRKNIENHREKCTDV